jgi:hypothetical protein
MALGTKNRQRQTAEACKQHLREKYRDRGALEGTGKDSDLTRWSSLTDVRGIEKEMLSRLDTFFETWLNP